MFSKIIPARTAGQIPAAVFPSVGTAPQLSAVRATDPVNERENAALREKIRQAEVRAGVDRKAAFEAGKQQGDQQARAELQPVLERLNASINEMASMRPDLRRRAERDVVQLSLLIAKRVLHREVGMDENALTAIARVAFERLTRSESYSVTVHPRFAESIKAALPGSQSGRVRIESDPDCAPGTLVIHSSEGVIDASVEAQLEEISRGLTDRLGDSRP